MNQATETRAATKTDQEWRQQLTAEQYQVLRHKGTEPPFVGTYTHTKDPGTYRCAGCGTALFSSDAKFDSGTGWPSFTAPAREDSVALHSDNFLFMRRTEVVCSVCGGHLVPIFNDGPRPTGKSYCINSCALKFEHDSGPAGS